MRVALVANLNLSGLQVRQAEPVLDSLVPPLGLLSLAAVIQASGHQAVIIDPNYEIDRGAISLGREFVAQTIDAVLAEKPDLVGFSTMCNSFHITLRLAERLKALCPDLANLLGGPQVSFVDQETLAVFPFIDFVLRGEAETSLPAFLRALDGLVPYAQIPGLSYRSAGAVVRNPPPLPVDDLDALPFPAWHLFRYDVQGAYSIDVGRGCPFACKFCSTSSFFQRRFRLKSFDRLIGEIRWLQQNYHAAAITFVHDLFTANRKWVRALCERLLREDNLQFAWSASARIDTVDEALLDIMGRAGCRALFYGIETGSPRLQRDVGKRLKIGSVVPITAATICAGIDPTLSFIAGFPTETAADLQATFELIDQLLTFSEANVQLHLMSPQSGTPDYVEFFSALRRDGYYSDIANGSPTLFELEWFTKHPELFPSFYYYDNPQLPRELLRGARTNARPAQAEAAGLAPDEYLLDFAEFAHDFCRARGIDNDEGEARDEIIAFYLRHYHRLEVHSTRPVTAVAVPSTALIEEVVT